MADDQDPWADVNDPADYFRGEPDRSPDDGVGKLASEIAEQSVIAAVLADPSWFDLLADTLDPADFSIPLYSRIYAVGVAEASAGRRVNIATIIAQIEDDEAYIERGGQRHLFDLRGGKLAFLDPRASAPLVSEMAEKRRLSASLRKILSSAGAPDVRTADILVSIDDALAGVLSTTASRATISFADAFDNAMIRIGQLKRGEISPGVMIYGLPEWNDITGGMKPGEVILLGGRPSMGKTAVALGVARRAAEAGHATLLISREMDTPALMPRMVADMLFEAGGRATFDAIQRGDVGPEDHARLAAIRARVADWPLEITDPTSLTASQIAPLVRRHQRKLAASGKKLELVILDYLGLVDPPAGLPNREQQVAGVSLAIKNAARECGVTMLVLSQLNRSVEQREDKRPTLSDLRDSGSLEQDADTVIFAYRAQYYLERSEPVERDGKKYDAWMMDMQAEQNRIDIYSRKRRQGALVDRKCYFFGAQQAVRSADYYRSGGIR